MMTETELNQLRHECETAKSQLAELRQILGAFAESSPCEFQAKDIHGRIIATSSQFSSLVNQLIESDSAYETRIRHAQASVLKERQTVFLDLHHAPTKRHFLYSQHIHMPRDANSSASILVTYLRDISRQIAAEHERDQLFNVSWEMLCVAGTDGYFKRINPTFTHILGYSLEELVSQPFMFYVHPDDRKQTQLEMEKLINGENSVEFINRYRAKNGEYRTFIWNCPAPRHKDDLLFASARDITEASHKERMLRQIIEEKDTLLKEVHHRVKNNLQVITSLINLQSSKMGHPMLTEALLEMQDRVRSMALLHETLYRSSDISRINMHSYLREITSFLMRAYGVGNDNFRMVLDVDEVLFDIDIALPCGMIVNELVSNALKHSFHSSQKGTLAIFFHKKPENRFDLMVCDNGVGFPVDFDWRNAPSLGLQLVRDWVDQLNGHISFVPDEGVTFLISFQVKEK